MADHLPLIPEKEAAACADVRPVLREVFRELDYLPPLAGNHSRQPKDNREEGDNTLPTVEPWIFKYDSECKEIWQREGELKQQHAKRISRKPLPNIYKLHPLKKNMSKEACWKSDQSILQRKDLMPAIEQNARPEDSLWVKNILNRSSGDLTDVKVRDSKMHLPVRQMSRPSSYQNMSFDETRFRPPCLLPPPPPPPQLPEHIICVPAHLKFINFTVGQLQTKNIRLVNVSKFECRLSIRPPERPELDIELCGTRGLAVSSGADTELKVHFRPRDVRVVRDTLLVRVSTGKSLVVSIDCYMQPPLLDIVVPAVPISIYARSDGAVGARSSDTLELGARLLGDVHAVRVLLRAEAEHAAFFALTEDAWLAFSLDVLTGDGSLVADPFVVSPAWWRGGGDVRGGVWCRARAAGLQTAALRVLASTAAVRPLHLLADSLLFRSDHITIQAHEKKYDICSADDPECEYFVRLGTAFPRQSLSATVQLINHSPVVYSYYWSVRPWGVCSCWEEEKATEGSLGPEDSERLCVSARETRAMELKGASSPSKCGTARYVRVQPSRGSLAPRSCAELHVCATDVGSELGIQRAVLMLILKDIPKESFPSDYKPMILKTEEVKSEPIPGIKSWTREVCEVVYAQMEVWWEVAPVRFVLDPPVLPLLHSCRVQSVDVSVRVTQLFGGEGLSGTWQLPQGMAALPPITMSPTHSCAVTIKCPLTVLPNEVPEVDIVTLSAAEAWQATCAIRRACRSRHAALRPVRAWLGVLAPGSHISSAVDIINDTYQHLGWRATPYRWMGENEPALACADGARCRQCHTGRCSCALLRPACGALAHGCSATITYDVNAPEVDGCVATLVQGAHGRGDGAGASAGAGVEARATLFHYRVLAPRLVLRVLPCFGDKKQDGYCEGCELDEGRLRSAGGTATLRPRAALTLGRRSCYRLRVSNLTPVATGLVWDPPLEDDVLNVVFIPNELEVNSYEEVEFQVTVEARRVCGRRLVVRRARARSCRPVYLLIDTAVSGLEIVCEVPIGENTTTDSKLVMRRSQREQFPWDADKFKPRTSIEMFEEEDRKRALRAKNICRCHCELEPLPPNAVPSVETVWEPLAPTRVCTCFGVSKPTLPQETFSLQFKQVPLNTVCTRIVTLRNESALTGTWSSAVRRWPRRQTRSLRKEEWRGWDAGAGALVSCWPCAGELGPRAAVRLAVQVQADCWGLYHDQLLIKIDKVEPMVVDVWVEACGAPLEFAMQPCRGPHPAPPAAPATPVLWLSAADPERSLLVRNTSRADLTVHCYLLTEHEHEQDALPFRLYVRFYDVPARTCACLAVSPASPHIRPDEMTAVSFASSCEEEMDTGIEIFLAPDCGLQENTFFEICPEVCRVGAGERGAWHVRLQPKIQAAPRACLLLRTLPVHNHGEGWYRPSPLPQRVRLREAARRGRLKVSVSELRVRLCALDLPRDGVLRVRKPFRIQNVAHGPLELTASTRAPWALVAGGGGGGGGGQADCDAGCSCGAGAEEHREHQLALHLPPRSSLEMCVEVLVCAAEAWPASALAPAGPPAPAPAPARPYPQWRRTRTKLHIYDNYNVLLTVPMHLELEYPVVSMQPAALDFGFITDGDTRKSYFTVSHSSRTATVDMVAEWIGGPEFRLWPRDFSLQPGGRERLYIRCTARWCGAPLEGCVLATAAAGGAGAWCRAEARVRASPARAADRKLHDDQLLDPGEF